MVAMSYATSSCGGGSRPGNYSPGGGASSASQEDDVPLHCTDDMLEIMWSQRPNIDKEGGEFTLATDVLKLAMKYGKQIITNVYC